LNEFFLFFYFSQKKKKKTASFLDFLSKLPISKFLLTDPEWSQRMYGCAIPFLLRSEGKIEK
jgi:hypothetical protein